MYSCDFFLVMKLKNRELALIFHLNSKCKEENMIVKMAALGAMMSLKPKNIQISQNIFLS